jgi:hypothetical protein
MFLDRSLVSKEHENKLTMSSKGFFISCSPKIVVGLLLGMFYPIVYELD